MDALSNLRIPDEYFNPSWRSCSLPYRPWWVIKEVDHDDQRIPYRSSKRHYMATRVLGNSTTEIGPLLMKHLFRKIEELDKEATHPPFRVGQIWLIYEKPIHDDQIVTKTIFQITSSWDLRLGLLNGLWGGEEKSHIAVLLHDPFEPKIAGWNNG